MSARRIALFFIFMQLSVLGAGGTAYAAIRTTSMAMPESMSDDKPFGYSIDSTVSRGFIEYEDVVDLEINGNIGYRLNKSHQLATTISHRGAIYRQETGTSLSTPIAHTERYGFTNLKFMHTMPELYSNDWSNLSLSNRLFLPTSEVARRASLNAALGTQLNWDIVANDRLTITPQFGIAVRSYRYDTANVIGTERNSPFSYFAAASLSYQIFRKLIGNVEYEYNNNLDYDNVWTANQKAQAGLQFSTSKTAMIHAEYSWKDKVLTNDEAFAAGKSSFGGGFKVSY